MDTTIQEPVNGTIVFTNHVGPEIDRAAGNLRPSSVYVITDSNVNEAVLTVLRKSSETLRNAETICFPAGEEHKNMETVQKIWTLLAEKKATRKSLVINIGGGVITDMGAFAAATYKRGMPFINVPTSLLAAVDASVGGKTGVNFNGLKNEVGVFRNADEVIISTLYFNTLPPSELRSGYAEMIKHAMLDSPEALNRILRTDITADDPDPLLKILEENIKVKQLTVAADPTENGPRKALNLGHTIGHVFEEMALENHTPVPHGYAVAWGLVVALVLSRMKLGFPSEQLQRLSAFIYDLYGAFPVTCDKYPHILELASHDKKNDTAEAFNFTLLKNIGEPVTDVALNSDDLTAALDIYRDLMKLP